MAFGQRGTLQNSPGQAASRPMYDASIVVLKPEASFSGDTVIGKEFDLDLGSDEIYADDKTLMAFIPLWIFLSGLGFHRFYLGHMRLGFAMWGMSAVVFYFNIGLLHILVKVAQGYHIVIYKNLSFGLSLIVFHCAWLFFDGVYVICRKLSAGLGR
jgi:TM2 domain-containing membrane protein YozV